MLLVALVLQADGMTYHRTVRSRLCQPLRCSAAPAAADRPSALGQPEIFSRKALFGNDFDAASAATSTAVSDELTIPEGLQRVEPTMLVAKTPRGADADSAPEYEEVDTFRFVIDAAALRKAVNQKQALQVRQQLSAADSGSEGDELTLDATFLSKLATATPKEGTPTTLQLEMDFDELQQMIRGNSDVDAVYEADAADGTDDLSAAPSSGRPKGLEYSEARMKEAELFLDSAGSRASTVEPPVKRRSAGAAHARRRSTPQTPSLSEPRVGRTASSPPDLSASVGLAGALLRAIARPYNGLHWSDVGPRTVADSVYCTCVVGAAMTLTVLAFVAISEATVAWCVRAFSTALAAVPALRARQVALQQSPKPLVFLAVVLIRLLWQRQQRIGQRSKFRGLGHTSADAF